VESNTPAVPDILIVFPESQSAVKCLDGFCVLKKRGKRQSLAMPCICISRIKSKRLLEGKERFLVAILSLERDA
jgi:hypothetical protein